jgi:hypothetical protein
VWFNFSKVKGSLTGMREERGKKKKRGRERDRRGKKKRNEKKGLTKPNA